MQRVHRGAYKLETSLVAQFARCLRMEQSPFSAVRVGFEFDYRGGWADVIALAPEGAVIAFEAKLLKWREALHQAYRTLCFAQTAYVVLPRAKARRVATHVDEFRRRRVGLCTISEAGAIEVLIESSSGAVLQPWLTELAVAELSKGKGGRCRLTPSSKQSQKQSAQIAA